MQGNKDFSRDEKKKTRIIIDVGFCLHNSLVKSVVGQTYDRVSFLQSACMGKYPCPPECGLSNSPFSFDDFDIKRGFLGQETYAAIAAMRFAANPPVLLWHVCSI